MRYGLLVIGPAGSGKSTFCHALQQHMEVLGRSCSMVNLDPAAEFFLYKPCIDVRELITVDEAAVELELGPNGALVYSMEFLQQHLDWLEEQVLQYGEDTFFVFDCPGQIELYTHLPLMKNICVSLQRAGVRLAACCCLDITFLTDAAKLFGGSLMALSAMVQLELPHINLLTKCDLINRTLPSSHVLPSSTTAHSCRETKQNGAGDARANEGSSRRSRAYVTQKYLRRGAYQTGKTTMWCACTMQESHRERSKSINTPNITACYGGSNDGSGAGGALGSSSGGEKGDWTTPLQDCPAEGSLEHQSGYAFDGVEQPTSVGGKDKEVEKEDREPRRQYEKEIQEVTEPGALDGLGLKGANALLAHSETRARSSPPGGHSNNARGSHFSDVGPKERKEEKREQQRIKEDERKQKEESEASEDEEEKDAEEDADEAEGHSNHKNLLDARGQVSRGISLGVLSCSSPVSWWDDNNGMILDDGDDDATSEELAKERAIDALLSRDPQQLLQQLDKCTPPGYRHLNAAFAALLEDYNLVSFLPCDLTEEDSLSAVALALEQTLQYGEDLEIRETDFSPSN